MTDLDRYTEASEDLIVRDLLALDRTTLANERTMLAYLRTFLTLVIVGVSFLTLTDHPILEVVGWIFLPSGFIIMSVGLWRFVRMKRVLSRLRDG